MGSYVSRDGRRIVKAGSGRIKSEVKAKAFTEPFRNAGSCRAYQLMLGA